MTQSQITHTVLDMQRRIEGLEKERDVQWGTAAALRDTLRGVQCERDDLRAKLAAAEAWIANLQYLAKQVFGPRFDQVSAQADKMENGSDVIVSRFCDDADDLRAYIEMAAITSAGGTIAPTSGEGQAKWIPGHYTNLLTRDTFECEIAFDPYAVFNRPNEWVRTP